MGRRAALPVQRLPARQLGRQAARAGHPALHARPGAQGAGKRDQPDHPRRRELDGQRETVDAAADLPDEVDRAIGPRTTVQSPLRWNEDGDWKQDYNNLARMPAEEVAKRRAEFDKVKQTALEQRKKAGVA